MEKVCTILCAGEMGTPDIPQDSFIICADGGLRHAERLGITPDLIVGDFDSLGRIPQGCNVRVHPIRKNETDSFLAAEYGMELGYRRFVIYGGLGGRFDHTFANVQLLHDLCLRGCRGTLIGADGTHLTAIFNETLMLDAVSEGAFAVFSLTEESRGVTIRGFSFECENLTLTSHTSRGASNAFCGKAGSVSVEDGVLLLMWKKAVE